MQKVSSEAFCIVEGPQIRRSFFYGFFYFKAFLKTLDLFIYICYHILKTTVARKDVSATSKRR